MDRIEDVKKIIRKGRTGVTVTRNEQANFINYPISVADLAQQICQLFESKTDQSRLLTEVRTMIDNLVVQVYGRVHQVDKDTECAKQILVKIDSIKDAEYCRALIEKSNEYTERLLNFKEELKVEYQQRIEALIKNTKETIMSVAKAREENLGSQRGWVTDLLKALKA